MIKKTMTNPYAIYYRGISKIHSAPSRTTGERRARDKAKTHLIDLYLATPSIMQEQMDWLKGELS